MNLEALTGGSVLRDKHEGMLVVSQRYDFAIALDRGIDFFLSSCGWKV